jgi:hypothetical protein
MTRYIQDSVQGTLVYKQTLSKQESDTRDNPIWDILVDISQHYNSQNLKEGRATREEF